MREHSDFWKTLESDDSSEETKIKFLLVEENTESDATIDAKYLKWEADKIQQGYLEGNAKQGSSCEECQQLIVDKRLRYYPALCESCSSSLEEGAWTQKAARIRKKIEQKQGSC